MHRQRPTWSHRSGFAALLCCLLITTAALLAGEAPAEGTEAAAPGKETVYSLFLKGGSLMYPILLCSIIVVTLAIERAISMRRRRVGTPELIERIAAAVPSRKQATAERLRTAAGICAEDVTLLGKLLQEGLVRLHRDEAHVQAAMEEAATKEMHRLHRRNRPFTVIATLAPLLGLLGTVIGMILCFGEASVAEATERAQKLSDGIYRALVTTAAGLCVAIPSMLLGHFYQGRVDSVIDLFDESATRFLDHFYGGRSLASEGETPDRSEPVRERNADDEPHDMDLPRSAAAR